jgi:hypothetical protein
MNSVFILTDEDNEIIGVYKDEQSGSDFMNARYSVVSEYVEQGDGFQIYTVFECEYASGHRFRIFGELFHVSG